MWLLPLLPRIGALATATFYKTTVLGGGIPRDGAVLLVGNHPNSLLDPLFLAAVARRPVRFLAKAPLFSDPRTSWAVKAVGAIPVYRPSDDPALVSRNANMFRAAHDALASGAAVGLFPEGVSHDAPALAPLRTGAARIALGARARTGSAIPIVPVGLVFRNKGEFRSEAHVVIGAEVSWAGIDGADDDITAARELTARIEQSLHAVTLNLEKWEDAHLVAAAEAIYDAERQERQVTNPLVQRWREAAHILSAARRSGDAAAVQLAREIRAHSRSLGVLGMTPRDLHARSSMRAAAGWSLRRIAMPLLMLTALIGAILFWPPYRVTALVTDRLTTDGSGRASVKLIAGLALFVVWIAVLASVMWAFFGWKVGVISLALLPPLAVGTLRLLEKSSDALSDVRRFFVLRSRASVVHDLRTRQRELAERLHDLRTRLGPQEA